MKQNLIHSQYVCFKQNKKRCLVFFSRARLIINIFFHYQMYGMIGLNWIENSETRKKIELRVITFPHFTNEKLENKKKLNSDMKQTNKNSDHHYLPIYSWYSTYEQKSQFFFPWYMRNTHKRKSIIYWNGFYK